MFQASFAEKEEDKWMRFWLGAAGSLHVGFFFLVGNGRCGGCLVARKWENGGDELLGVPV